MKTIPYLTLQATWAQGVAHLGKDRENRSERMCKTIIKTVGYGWLAIHASRNPPGINQRLAAGCMAAVSWHAGWKVGTTSSTVPGAVCLLFRRAVGDAPVKVSTIDTPASAIVALARVAGIRAPSSEPDSPWQELESYAVVLHDVITLRKPIPMKGAQGVQRTTAQIDAQLRLEIQQQREPLRVGERVFWYVPDVRRPNGGVYHSRVGMVVGEGAPEGVWFPRADPWRENTLKLITPDGGLVWDEPAFALRVALGAVGGAA